jgi:hypothetical protein
MHTHKGASVVDARHGTAETWVDTNNHARVPLAYHRGAGERPLQQMHLKATDHRFPGLAFFGAPQFALDEHHIAHLEPSSSSAPSQRLPVTRPSSCPSGRPAAVAGVRPAGGVQRWPAAGALARLGDSSREHGAARAGCGEAPAGVCA